MFQKFKVVGIKKIQPRLKTYDIEVKDNHNFFVNGILSSNCHLASINSIYKIAMLMGNAKIIGLSGTSWRADGNTIKMNAALGYATKNNIKLKTLIDLGYLCDFEVKDFEVDGIIDKYSTYPEAYEEQITNNIERNKLISQIAKENKKPVLIFVDKLSHGENIATLLPTSKTIFFNGTLKKRDRGEKFEKILNGYYDYVIATKVFQEGVNIPILYSLIYAGSSKSSIRVIQQLGRVLRLHKNKDIVTVIHFKDNCKWFKNHYKERCEIFKWEKEIK